MTQRILLDLRRMHKGHSYRCSRAIATEEEMNMFRRLATAGVAVGVLIAAGAVLANAGMSPTAPLATASNSVASTVLANGSGPTTPGTPGGFESGWGGRHGGFGFGHRGGGLTVTSVNGNTITATGRGGQTIT